MKSALNKKRRCYNCVFLVGFYSFSASSSSANEQLPDMAFLEYLAELVEVNGELVGPQDITDNMIKSNIRAKIKVKEDEIKKTNDANGITKQEDK